MISRLQKQLTKKILLATMLGTVGMNMWNANSVGSANDLVIDGTVTGDQVAKEVDRAEKTLTGNTVTVTDTGNVKGNVYAVKSASRGTAENNKVTVAGKVTGNVAAVSVVYGPGIRNNTVEILKVGNITGNVYGAWINDIGGRFSSGADHNNVIINGTSADDKVIIRGNLYGSYVYSYGGAVKANDNNVQITNADIKGSVYGGYVGNWPNRNQNASGNTVTLTDSVVDGNVYGGLVIDSGRVPKYNKRSNDNNVILNNATVNGSLIGGVASGKREKKFGNETVRNSLVVSGVSQAKSISNFNNFTFIVSDANSISIPVLTLTDSKNKVNLKSLNNMTVLGYAGNGKVSLLKYNGGTSGLFKTITGNDKISADDNAVYAVGNYTVEWDKANKSIDYTAKDCVVAGTYLSQKGVFKSTSVGNEGVLNLSNNIPANTIAGIYNKDKTHASGNASGGTVNINGGTYDTVYGGYSATGGATTGNTVNLKGEGTVTTLSGGNNDSNITGNTLNIDSYFSTSKIENFDTINFIDESFTDAFATPTLTVNGAWNLDNVKNISVDMNGKVKKGVYYLAKATGGLTNTTDTNYKVTLNGAEVDNKKPVTTEGYAKAFGKIDLGLAMKIFGDSAPIYKKSTENGGVDSIAVRIDTDTIMAGKLTTKEGNEYISKGGIKLPDGTESKAGELVLDGSSDADLIAGVYDVRSRSDYGIANGGHVIITGGTYNTNVYGGYGRRTSVPTYYNTVDLKGKGEITGTLYGGSNGSNYNILNVDSYFSAGNIKNFADIYFLDENFADTYATPTLTVTGTKDDASKWKIGDVRIFVDMKGLSDDKLKKGVYYLAKATNGIDTTDGPTGASYIIKIDGVSKVAGHGEIAKCAIDPVKNAGYVKSVGEVKLGLANSSKGQKSDIYAKSDEAEGIDSIAVGVSDNTKLAGKMIPRRGKQFLSLGGVTLADGTKSQEGDLVLDGSANADIIAGVYNENQDYGARKGTNIYIQGGSYDKVYGVSSTYRITTDGTNVSWWSGSINDTLAVAGDKAKAGSNNSLTIYAGKEDKSIKNITGFDKYTFVVDNDTLLNKKTMLTVTDNAVDLNKATVSVDMNGISTGNLKRGVYYLANVNKGITTDQTDYIIKIDGKDVKSEAGSVAKCDVAPIVSEGYVKLVGEVKLGLAKKADGTKANDIKPTGSTSDVDTIALGVSGDSVLAGKVTMADGNTISSEIEGVLILDGSTDADIIAGVYNKKDGKADEGHVIIAGGTYDTVYGGYDATATSGSTSNNTVNLVGIGSVETLSGGNKTAEGNTLNVDSYFDAGKIENFETINFLDESFTDDYETPTLTVTGIDDTTDKWDLSDVKTISVDMSGVSDDKLKKGVYYLATAKNGINAPDAPSYVINVDGNTVATSTSDGIATGTLPVIETEGYVKSVGEVTLGLTKSGNTDPEKISAKTDSSTQLDSIAVGVSDETKLAGQMIPKSGDSSSSSGGVTLADGKKSQKGDLVLDGNSNADIIAGVYTDGSAGKVNGTNIYIQGGSYDNIYGVYSANTTVTTDNTNVSWWNGSISDTLSVGGKNTTADSNNSLTIYAGKEDKSIKNVTGFDKYNFVANNDTVLDKKTMLTVNGTEPMKLDNATVSVDMNGVSTDNLERGVYYLANVNGGIQANNTKYIIKIDNTEVTSDNGVAEYTLAPIVSEKYVKLLGELKLGLAKSKDGQTADKIQATGSTSDVNTIALGLGGDSVLAGKVTMADGKTTQSKENGLLVLDGKADADIIAGIYNKNGEANKGHVIITGGTYNSVYGGYANTSVATNNNTVDLKGDGKITGTLSGGNKTATGNTLNVDSYFSAGKIEKFDTINFQNESFADDYAKPTLTVTDTLDLGDVCKISVDMKGLSDDKLKKGVYYLATAQNGINATTAPLYVINIDGNEKVTSESGKIAIFTIDPVVNKGYVKSVGDVKLGLTASGNTDPGNISATATDKTNSIAVGVSDNTKLAGKMILTSGSPYSSSGGVILADGKESQAGDLVLDGSANADIIAGVYNEKPDYGAINDTKIYIQGGSYDKVYGVYSKEDVTVNGTNVSWWSGSISDTLAVGGDNSKAGTGNSLTIYAGKEDKSIKNITGFDKYNFVMDNDTALNKKTMLTVTGDKAMDLNNATVSVDMNGVSTDNLERGVYYLANVNNGITTDQTNYIIKIDGKDVTSEAGSVAKYDIAPIVSEKYVKLLGELKLGLAKSADETTADDIQATGSISDVNTIALGLGGDSVLAGKVTMADGNTSWSKENGLLVLDGNLNADIIAGAYNKKDGTANGGHVIITKGIYDTVYGGYNATAADGSTSNNIVDLIGVGFVETLSGGNGNKEATGNILNVSNYFDAGKIEKFDTINFQNESFADDYEKPTLTVTGIADTTDKWDLSGVKIISVDMKGLSDDKLKKGVYYLATAKKGINATAAPFYVINIDGNKKATSKSGEIATYTIDPVVNKGYVKSVGEVKLGLANSSMKQSATLYGNSDTGVDSIAVGVSDETKLAGQMTVSGGGKTISNEGVELADGTKSKAGDLVLDGSANADIIAGVYTEELDLAEIKGTNVYIQGGSYKDVYGAYSNVADATVNDANVHWWAGSINDTLAVGGGNAKAGSNNSLTIYAGKEDKSIKNITGFDKYNFVVDNDTALNKKTMLTVTGDKAMDLNNATVSVDMNGVSTDNLERGVYYLANVNNGITTDQTNYIIKIDGKDVKSEAGSVAKYDIAPIVSEKYVKLLGELKLGLAKSADGQTAEIKAKGNASEVDSIALGLSGNSVLAGKVTMADGTTAQSKENGLLVLDGKAGADIIAGIYNKNGEAKEGHVIITGGTYDAVYGGYSGASAATTKNIVTLKGQGTVATLYGGNDDSNITGNTLNVDSYFSAGNIKNFEKINFVDESFADDYAKPTLTVTGADKWNLKDVTEISVDMKGLSDDKLKKGVYYLATAQNGINATAAPSYVINIDGNKKATSASGKVAIFTIDPVENAGYVKSVGVVKLGLTESGNTDPGNISATATDKTNSIAVGVSDYTKLAGKMILTSGSPYSSSGGIALADGKKSQSGDLVLDGSANADIIAGVYNEKDGTANGGHVIITKGAYDTVYGGYATATGGSTSNNVVDLIGAGSVENLSGGNKTATGNTLNVDSYFSAGNIENFETINFQNESFVDDYENPTLTVTGTAGTTDRWDLSGVKTISVDMRGVSDDKLKKGVYYLATAPNGINAPAAPSYVINIDGKTKATSASGEVAKFTIPNIETAGYVKSVGDVKLGLTESGNTDPENIYAKTDSSTQLDSIAVSVSGDTKLAGKMTLANGSQSSSSGGVTLADGKNSQAGDLVLDGSANADIIAGVYNEKDSTANGGHVIITKGTYDTVYGGYNAIATGGSTSNNVVDLIGVGSVKTLSGGNKTATGNTLNVDSYFSAGNIKNFEKINFLDESFVDDYAKPTLTVTGTEKWDLKDVKEISVDMKGLSDDKIKKGVYYLATAKRGISATTAPSYVISIDGDTVATSASGEVAKITTPNIKTDGYVKSVGEVKLGLTESGNTDPENIYAKTDTDLDSIAVGVSDETILAGSLTKDGNKAVSNGGVTLADVIKSEEGDLVLDGSANADIIAGVYTDKTGITEVKGTNVHILGGSYDSVYGAYSKKDAPTVTGTNVSWWNGSISDTLAVGGGSAEAGSNNSLTIYDGAAAKSVKDLNGFDNYNFVLNNYSSVDKPVLSAKKLVAPARINLRLMLAIDANKAGAPDFKTGDKVTLLKTDDILPNVEYDGIGNTCTYDTMATTQLFELKKDENNIFAKVVNTSANKNSKALAEIKLGSSIAINDAINMTAGEGIKRATEAAETDANGEYAVFAGVSGGKTRNETGSYVDAKGTSFMVGFARRMDMNNGYMTNGMFVEYGTHSLESHVNDLISTGNSKYYGLGWLTKRVLNNNVYMEGSVHIGNVHSDYDGDNKGYALAHSSTSTYAGMHVGIGKTFKIGEDTSWDVYTKYFFSHVGAADYNIRGYDVNLGAVNTHRLALGTRWNKQLDDKTSFYVGAAVNKTFGGDQNGTIHGYTMDTPTISGCYGEFELGASIKTSKATAIDFGLKAYAGDRKGVTANVGFTFSF